MTKKPFIIDVRRNGIAESTHHVHGIAMDRDGQILDSWGDISAMIYPRSTLKPVQALPLVETGAAEAFKVTEQELALSAASHEGQAEHVALARAWLNRIGLTESDFECGAHWPYHKASEHALCAAHQKPCSLHNNCSGKHLGMMTACLHQGWPVEGYTHPDHPLQKMILETFAGLAHYPAEKMTVGIDGCSAPNPALPLENIARAYVNLMTRNSGMRILAAMSQNPFFVGGADRFDTALITAGGGDLVSKVGAEGSLAIFNLAEKKLLYFKAEDGNIRATDVAAGKILSELGWVTDDAGIAIYTRPVIKNRRGIETGDIVLRA